ncbi:MAG: hypothetical protein ACYC4L_09220 [Chloroflexota bacterium]
MRLSERGAAWVVLLAAAALSLEIYWLRWTSGFPLVELHAVRHVDIGSLTHYERAQAALWVFCFAALFGLYGLAARKVRRLGQDRRALPAVLGAALLFGLALAFSFPMGALDIYGYLFQGQIIAHYQANPYLLAPAHFADDPWLKFLAWPNESANYGPLWLQLSALGAWAAAGDLLRGLLAFKLGGLLAVLLTAYTVYRFLLPRGTGEALAGALLVAWNPLVLFETAVNGHNDIAMASLAMLALLAQARGRPRLAYPLLIASALIKFVTIITLPALLVGWARGARWRGGELTRAWDGLLLAGGLLVLVYWPLWAGTRTLGFLQRGELFTASPGAVAYQLAGGAENALASTAVKLIAGGLFVAFALWRSWRTGPLPEDLAAASCDLLLAYLGLVSFWFQPWYVVAVVPFAVAADPRRRQLVLLFSASALGNYFVFNYLWLWNLEWFTQVRLQTTAVAVIYGPPVLLALRQAWLWRQQDKTVRLA